MGVHASEELSLEGSLVDPAAALSDEKLSFLKELIDSLNLGNTALSTVGEAAIAIIAPILAALGLDDVLPDAPTKPNLTNPSSVQQVGIRSDTCSGAKGAGEVKDVGDLTGALGEITFTNDEQIPESTKKEAQRIIEKTYFTEWEEKFNNRFPGNCPEGGNHNPVIEANATVIDAAPGFAAFAVTADIHCTKCLQEIGPISDKFVIKTIH